MANELLNLPGHAPGKRQSRESGCITRTLIRVVRQQERSIEVSLNTSVNREA